MNTSTETKKLDGVLAHGPEGKLFLIPFEVAEQYEIEDPHGNDQAPDGDIAEGRHQVWLVNLGGFGFHINCLFGPYVAPNGFSYTGVHFHPNGGFYGLAC